jgi:hypothetical protein
MQNQKHGDKMGTVKLRRSIHKIVDKIDNEELLQTLHDFLKIRTTTKPGRLWDSLTEKQKQEVLLAYEESEDESNLVPKDEAFKKAK